MKFTDDVREAGLLFEEYGYKINALPVPPSWYIPNPKITYTKRYQFITRLYRYDGLPVIPSPVMQIWSNFQQYNQRFTDLVFREQ